MMTEVIGRQDLDAARCENPACDCKSEEVFIGPRCHRGDVAVSYRRATATLLIRCAECGAGIVEVAVGERPPRPRHLDG